MHRFFRFGNHRSKSFDINKKPSTFKVHYLGNIQTSLTKGDGCADRPAKLLWDMHVKNNGRLGRKLKLTITSGGLEAESYCTPTKEITKYNTNRIAYYYVAQKINSKLFIWVYRHVNIRSGLTTELRCHACLVQKEEDAKLLMQLLHNRLQETLKEYIREKHRRQVTRLSTAKQTTLPPKRVSTLSLASNYRPSLTRSMSNIGIGRLDSIDEDEEHQHQQQINYNNKIDRSQSNSTENNQLQSESIINDDPEILLTLKNMSLNSSFSTMDSILSTLSSYSEADNYRFIGKKTKKLLYANALSDIL